MNETFLTSGAARAPARNRGSGRGLPANSAETWAVRPRSPDLRLFDRARPLIGLTSRYRNGGARRRGSVRLPKPRTPPLSWRRTMTFARGERDGGLEAYAWEWGSALIRWLHVTAAIAWIGGSFFFMHLDASLRKHAGDDPAIAGVVVAGARRRLLSDEQIHARAGVAAGGAHLAQVAVLLDLDQRLHAAVLGLLRPVAALSRSTPR